MGVEIERKFLVVGDSWRDGGSGVRMAQGYLSADAGCAVRVRVAGGRAWLTVKGGSEGISRPEFEYEIPAVEAVELLKLCVSRVVEKTRHRVEFGGCVWEVDEFHGENAGLVMAEVELEDESEEPELPPWAGREVSGDVRYFNASLSRVPFSEFG